jgi:hypothetical protein
VNKSLILSTGTEYGGTTYCWSPSSRFVFCCSKGEIYRLNIEKRDSPPFKLFSKWTQTTTTTTSTSTSTSTSTTTTTSSHFQSQSQSQHSSSTSLHNSHHQTPYFKFYNPYCKHNKLLFTVETSEKLTIGYIDNPESSEDLLQDCVPCFLQVIESTVDFVFDFQLSPIGIFSFLLILFLFHMNNTFFFCFLKRTQNWYFQAGHVLICLGIEVVSIFTTGQQIIWKCSLVILQNLSCNQSTFSNFLQECHFRSSYCCCFFVLFC